MKGLAEIGSKEKEILKLIFRRFCMKTRSIEMSIKKPGTHWVGNGFHVSNYFPSGANLLERFSPFILMDYNAPLEFLPSETPRGVGAHPHRGFETVTFALEGAVEHHDNQGNHGIIYPGDVQWMTAGGGILHKEYHEASFNKTGGLFHMIQLWVNLPKQYKMTNPRYQAIVNKDMKKVVMDNESATITIVAGEFNGVAGPAKTFSPMNIYIVDLNGGEKISLNEPSNYNVGILILNGDIHVNGESHNESDFVLFHNEEGTINLEAPAGGGKIFVLSGEPINEPIAAGGPFVMNTTEELRQAQEDFYNGKFGDMNF